MHVQFDPSCSENDIFIGETMKGVSESSFFPHELDIPLS